MMYLYYGSLAILVWKCGTQLLSEIQYKSLDEEADVKKKGQNRNGDKYQTIIY